MSKVLSHVLKVDSHASGDPPSEKAAMASYL
jgi:hypothetical protein